MNVKYNTKDFVIIMHFWQLSAPQHITHCWDHTQLTSDKHSEVIRISRVNISELEAAAGDQEIADLVRGDYTQPGGDRGTLNCAAENRPKVLTPGPGTPPLSITSVNFNFGPLLSRNCRLFLCLLSN